MKRLLAIVLSLAVALCFTACSIGHGEYDALPNDNETSDDKNDGASTDTSKDSKEEVSISETVLLDEKGVKITAKAIEEGWLGTELKLLIENNSGKNLTVQTDDSSVNNFMIDTIFSCSLADGKKANESITLMSSSLEKANITDIADIEFIINIFDTDSFENYLKSEPITIKTSIAEGFDYTYVPEGTTVYEDNGIKIVVLGLDDDALLGTNIDLYIENNTDKTYTVQTRDSSVNGFMVDFIYSSTVAAGKRAIDNISILSTYLEENEIETIEEIELSFSIFDFDNWLDSIETDVVKVSFN